jgi:hypothetical protein
LHQIWSAITNFKLDEFKAINYFKLKALSLSLPLEVSGPTVNDAIVGFRDKLRHFFCRLACYSHP